MWTSRRAQAFTLGCILAAAVASGQIPDAQAVVGRNANIHLTSSPARGESVVVAEYKLRSGDPPLQAVYLLHHIPGGRYPENWSGQAWLMTSQEALVVWDREGARAVFRFSSRPLPAFMQVLVKDAGHSLVHGYALYGENQRLTVEQIQNLRASGSVHGARSGDCGNCPSNGTGAAQCTIQEGGAGCSAQCDPGKSHACCHWASARQPVCKCCTAP
jgi:hypothetical protein